MNIDTHICEEQPPEISIDLIDNKWVIAEIRENEDIERLFNAKYCPYCGEKLPA